MRIFELSETNIAYAITHIVVVPYSLSRTFLFYFDNTNHNVICSSSRWAGSQISYDHTKSRTQSWSQPRLNNKTYKPLWLDSFGRLSRIEALRKSSHRPQPHPFMDRINNVRLTPQIDPSSLQPINNHWFYIKNRSSIKGQEESPQSRSLRRWDGQCGSTRLHFRNLGSRLSLCSDTKAVIPIFQPYFLHFHWFR